MSRANTFRIRQQAVIFNNEGKVLLLQYLPDSKESNKWDLVGGHLEEGENWKNGLKREILEETGLEVDDITPFRVFSYKNTYIIFFACFTRTSFVKLSSEHQSSSWLFPEELNSLNLVRENILDDVLLAKNILDSKRTFK